MNDLIARLEAASDNRRVAVALFKEITAELGDECPQDFKHHVHQADITDTDRRAWGYLLLAALALVPEGRHWEVVFSPTAFDREDGRVFSAWVRKVLTKSRAGSRSFTPALALTIAAMKAREHAD